MANISKRCVGEIEKRGIKKAFVAARLGMSKQSFSDLINGRRRLQVEEAFILADLFSLDVDEVVDGDDVATQVYAKAAN